MVRLTRLQMTSGEQWLLLSMWSPWRCSRTFILQCILNCWRSWSQLEVESSTKSKEIKNSHLKSEKIANFERQEEKNNLASNTNICVKCKFWCVVYSPIFPTIVSLLNSHVILLLDHNCFPINMQRCWTSHSSFCCTPPSPTIPIFSTWSSSPSSCSALKKFLMLNDNLRKLSGSNASFGIFVNEFVLQVLLHFSR